MKTVSAVALFMLALSSCSLHAQSVSGQEVYAKNCLVCHGQEGKGNPVMAQVLKTPILPLGSKAVQAKSDARLKKDVLEGTGKMKACVLTPAETEAIIAYMRGLPNNKTAQLRTESQ